jgi:hypothetical protein
VDAFSYRTGKGPKVFIQWRGRTVRVLAGTEAARFLERVAGQDDDGVQLVCAKVTGNFKRGNERVPPR